MTNVYIIVDIKQNDNMKHPLSILPTSANVLLSVRLFEEVIINTIVSYTVQKGG